MVHVSICINFAHILKNKASTSTGHPTDRAYRPVMVNAYLGSGLLNQLYWFLLQAFPNVYAGQIGGWKQFEPSKRPRYSDTY